MHRVFDMVEIGLAILDRDLHVRHWNRWMKSHSDSPQADQFACLQFFSEMAFRSVFYSVISFLSFTGLPCFLRMRRLSISTPMEKAIAK